MSLTRRSFVAGLVTAPVALRFVPALPMPRIDGARIGAAVGSAVGAAIAASLMGAQDAMIRYVESLPTFPPDHRSPEEIARTNALWAEVEREEERQRRERYF